MPPCRPHQAQGAPHQNRLKRQMLPALALLVLHQAAGHRRRARREQLVAHRLADVLQTVQFGRVQTCKASEGKPAHEGTQMARTQASQQHGALPAALSGKPCKAHLVDQDALAVGVDARSPRPPRHLPIAAAGSSIGKHMLDMPAVCCGSCDAFLARSEPTATASSPLATQQHTLANPSARAPGAIDGGGGPPLPGVPDDDAPRRQVHACRQRGRGTQHCARRQEGGRWRLRLVEATRSPAALLQSTSSFSLFHAAMGPTFQAECTVWTYPTKHSMMNLRELTAHCPAAIGKLHNVALLHAQACSSWVTVM